MKMINTFLSFTGLSSLMLGAILQVLGLFNTAYMLFIAAGISLAMMLLFYFYKMYIILHLKKDDKDLS